MMQTLSMLICVLHVTLLGNFRGTTFMKGCAKFSQDIISFFLFLIFEGGNYVPLNKIELKINYICIDINSQYVQLF